MQETATDWAGRAMIELPDFSKKYDYETFFHLTLEIPRLAKLIAHYEAYKMVVGVPGEIVECGVFKGTSFTRFGLLRQLLGTEASAKLVAFDVFSDEYPTTAYQEDQAQRTFWIQTAGPSSISVPQLEDILGRLRIANFELVAGDVCKTVPRYVKENPHLKISLLNVDIDFVEPTTCVLEHLYDRVCRGGVVLLDNYAAFHGDTKGIDDFFRDRDARIRRFPFASRPCYVVKD
jgi:hypothetical protein